MEKKNVLNGNKLITEFMNVKKDIYDKQPMLIMGDKILETFDKTPHFHNSWDWLMPVVEKIEDFSEVGSIEICTGAIFIWSSSEINSKIIVEEHVIKSKIEAVYKTVIKFIKWYNKNKINDMDRP